MFRWFGRKSKPSARDRLASLLKLNDQQFAEAVAGMMARADQATCAMIVVAHCNYGPIEGALEQSMRRQGKSPDCPEADHLRDLALRQILEKEPRNAIESRRDWWLASAMLIRRLDRRARRSPPLSTSASSIWARLIDGAQLVPKLLENNTVWTPNEKRYVLASMSRDGVTPPSSRDAMHFVLRMLLPRDYQAADTIGAVVQQHGLKYFGE